MLPPGEIEYHFSSADTDAKRWGLDAEELAELLEEATSGNASSQVVGDDSKSESNIDELLNEDKKLFGGTSQAKNPLATQLACSCHCHTLRDGIYSVCRTFLRLTSVLGAKAALRSPGEIGKAESQLGSTV